MFEPIIKIPDDVESIWCSIEIDIPPEEMGDEDLRRVMAEVKDLAERFQREWTRREEHTHGGDGEEGAPLAREEKEETSATPAGDDPDAGGAVPP